MKRKTKGKKGHIAFKIDISNAYSRIDWGFLEEVMLKQLALTAEGLILSCSTVCAHSVKYSALVNDKVRGWVLLFPIEALGRIK